MGWLRMGGVLLPGRRRVEVSTPQTRLVFFQQPPKEPDGELEAEVDLGRAAALRPRAARVPHPPRHLLDKDCPARSSQPLGARV